MIIFHASDFHGRYKTNTRSLGYDAFPDMTPDLWILTGDMFPNKTRGREAEEIPYQARWFRHKCDSIISRLRGAPVLCVGGNHDYINMALRLRSQGVEAYEVTPQGVTVKGIRFAGFREIPYIAGEWNGESDRGTLQERVFDTFEEGNPDILVTHAPPQGILDGTGFDEEHVGIEPLTTALMYRNHNVKVHCFGHVHEQGGRSITEHGIRFYNSAETVTWFEF